MDEAAAVRALLDERPDLEAALREILAVDDSHETWTFDDIPVDSGAFGELVGEGVIEKVDGEYRVAHPAAVRRALGDAGTDERPDTHGTGRAWDSGASADGDTRGRVAPALPTVEPILALAVLGSVAVVVAFRLVSLPQVFRNGDVVLSGNDPYYYRYWVEQLTSQAAGPFDLAVAGDLPPDVANGEPLYVATAWWLSSLLGGGATIVGWVLAWYPVVSAVVTSLLLYGLAVRLSRDRRVGVAAVLMLAIVPGHALRTGLGFGDHHAFDYVWLALTLLALVWLATRERAETDGWRPSWPAVALGLGVAGQALAWEAGPLLLLPIAVYVLIAVPLGLRAGHGSGPAMWSILAGLATGGVGAAAGHVVFGWHTPLVAFAPALLTVGVALVVGAGVLAGSTGLSSRWFVAGEVVTGILGVVSLPILLPAYWGQFIGELDRLVGYTGTIAETRSLFSGDSLGFLLLLGLHLILALPFIVWATWRGINRRSAWLIPAIYAWYLVLLAGFQVRFVGEFGVVVALFAGLGFVWVASWVDAAEPVRLFGNDEDGRRATDSGLTSLGRPSRGQLGALVGVFLLVGWLGMVQVPIKTAQVTIDDDTYATATWIEDAADERLAYPQNYVFSEWGRNRAVNYFVNGESASYSFAQGNYADFLAASNEPRWYERLNDRVGYVLTQDGADTPDQLGSRLHDAMGSRRNGVAGLAHFQTVFVSPAGPTTVARVVPGATIRGTGQPNATVRLATAVEVPGAQFQYRRQVRTTASGTFSATVAYPGDYRVAGENVTVPPVAVERGRTVALGE